MIRRLHAYRASTIVTVGGLLVLVHLGLPTARAQHCYAYVASESEDEVTLVHFDGKSLQVEATVPVGVWPAEIEGPHGLAVDPAGAFWYVSVAHGNPYGSVYKFRTGTNEPVGRVELGLFPATMTVSPATGLLYVVNFNLHGDMVPSTVSIVDPVEMVELGQTTTGIMPHGGRFSGDGLLHYSVSMMDGRLFEIDALTFEVRRSMTLDASGDEQTDRHAHQQARQPQGRDSAATDEHHGMTASARKPTWAAPHPFRPLVYVAANGSGEVLEVDVASWQVKRVFSTDRGPYNIDVSPDGRLLVVTYKGAQSTGIWNLETGEETGKIKNTRPITHGVAITDDSRFAFVTAEGVGSEPGTVDVIDLEKAALVATVDVGKQAGGVAFWKCSDQPIR